MQTKLSLLTQAKRAIPQRITSIVLLMLLVIAGLSYAPSIKADPVIWDQVTEFYGGSVNDTIVAPNDSNTVFVATGGEIVRTTNGGENWTKVREEGAHKLWIRSSNASCGYTIYAGPSSDLYKSTNGGSSWTKISSGVIEGKRVTGLGFRANILYASTHWGRVYQYGPPAGWTLLKDGLPNTYGMVYPGGIFGDQVNWIYLATEWGVYKTEDGGTNWTEKFSSWTDDLAMGRRTGFGAPYYYLYAATKGAGVYRSDDHGENWTSAGLAGKNVIRVYALPVDGDASSQTVYAIAYEASNLWTVYKSTNGGANWSAIPGEEKIIRLALGNSSIYGGTKGEGVKKSPDGGSAWNYTKFSAGIQFNGLTISQNYATDGTVFLGISNCINPGVYRTTNKGVSWESKNTGLTSIGVTILETSPNYVNDQKVYAGIGSTNPMITNGGIFKSEDRGENWTCKNGGLNIYNVNTLAISSNFAVDDTLYASVTMAGEMPMPKFLKSMDEGETWTDITGAGGLPFGPPFAIAISQNYGSDNTVYAGFWYDQGVYKTTDGGTNWSAVNTGLGDLNISSLAISPSSADIVYSGTKNAGVFKTINGGGSWSGANTGLTDSYITSLFISPSFDTDNTVFAGTKTKGVFISTDGGDNWSEANSGLATHIKGLVISPEYSTDNTAFTTTGLGGFKGLKEAGPTKYYIINLPYYLDAVRSDTDVSVEYGEPGAEGQTGTWSVAIKRDSDNVKIAELPGSVNFNYYGHDLNWYDVDADMDNSEYKSFIDINPPDSQTKHPEVDQDITLYIPKGSKTSVRVCQGATSLDEVFEGCYGHVDAPNVTAEYTITEAGIPQVVGGTVQGTPSLSTEGGYWKLAGIYGTGAQGEGGEGNGEVPEFTTITIVIAALGGFGIYLLIRRRNSKRMSKEK